MPTRLQRGLALCVKPAIAWFTMCGICAILLSSPAVADTTSAPPPLTLEAAIAKALLTAPALAEAQSLEQAAQADLAQAHRRQNPELGIEAENILGTDNYTGLDSAEFTLGLTQPIELPVKRKHRLASAAGDADLGHQQTDAARADAIHAVTVAFVEAAIAQQRAVLMETQLAIVEAQYKSVSAKVDAGKEPPLQERKAYIDVTESRLALQQSQQQARSAKDRLQLVTGMVDIVALDVAFLDKTEEPAAFPEYRAAAARAPDLRAAAAEIKTAEARAAYAGVTWLPDPSVTLGLRDMRDSDSQAMIVGVSLPIPVADRYKAGTRAAQQRAQAAIAAERKIRQTIDQDILRLHTDLSSAYKSVTGYRADIIPAAAAAADLARRGYEAGKFQYIDMLDAGRTLAQARQAENDALLTYHLTKADLERRTGRHDHHAAEAQP